jgi:hypothetical protein
MLMVTPLFLFLLFRLMKLPEFHSCRLTYQYWARLRLANQFSSDIAFRLQPIPVLKIYYLPSATDLLY